jgi:methionyl-tRNA formyltransferase
VPALRLVFFGTPEIAVPTLERLIAGPHEVVGVVSQPDRARGRGRKKSPSPVSAIALREDIPLLRPEHIGDTEAVSELKALRPDVGIVVAFGQFLPKRVREMPSCGYLINAHASLLPKYRGASPIAQAILDGESETGISVMRVEREMDAGPVALVMRTAIEPRENTAELSSRLSEMAATAIEETVERIARGDVEWTAQDANLATVAPKLEKSDSVLDLRESARALASRIHALSPKPGGALTLVTGRAESESDDTDHTVLKISRADVVPYDVADRTVDGTCDAGNTASASSTSSTSSASSTSSTSDPEPGTLERNVDGVALRIATADGWLVPLVMQRAGGKPLPVADFLRGFEIGEDARCALPDPSAETGR